jgi:DNA-binding FadR family transcriptional regulator
MAVKDGFLQDIRSWLAASALPNRRLPPERELATRFGVGRAEIRKALAVLETEGLLERQVGRGTFLKLTAEDAALHPNAAQIAARISPPEAMQARIMVEPEIARLAASTATTLQVNAMRALNARMRSAKTWSEYEDLDWKFHGVLAEATGNFLLIEIQRMVNGVRRAVVWGHLEKREVGPEADYHSFAEHDAIVNAIAQRKRKEAAAAMLLHLQSTASALREDLD